MQTMGMKSGRVKYAMIFLFLLKKKKKKGYSMYNYMNNLNTISVP